MRIDGSIHLCCVWLICSLSRVMQANLLRISQVNLIVPSFLYSPLPTCLLLARRRHFCTDPPPRLMQKHSLIIIFISLLLAFYLPFKKIYKQLTLKGSRDTMTISYQQEIVNSRHGSRIYLTLCRPYDDLSDYWRLPFDEVIFYFFYHFIFLWPL